MRRIVKYCLAAFVLFITTNATFSSAANWGEFRPEHCSLTGKRQYSSRLWNIEGSWETACAKTPATINGKTYQALCKNEGIGGMWGRFDVDDESCPRWGEWRREGCETIPGEKGLQGRRYSARLWDAPKATSWQAACADEPVVIGTYDFPGPHLCKGAGDIELAKGITRGVFRGAAALAGIQKKGAGAFGANSSAGAEASKELTSEIVGYFDKQDVRSADVGVIDERTKSYEMWGVVWVPDSTCK